MSTPDAPAQLIASVRSCCRHVAKRLGMSPAGSSGTTATAVIENEASAWRRILSAGVSGLRIEHFPWVEDAVGIQDPPELAHDCHLRVASEFGQE
jgi:hypothetical protein